jgi:hypothetical protein
MTTPIKEKIEPYREFARRQHRMLATYAALKAWEHRVECVWVERGDLGKFLGLVNFRPERPGWLEEDVKHLFPHVTFYEYEDGWVSDVAFSRVAIADLSVPVKTRETYFTEFPRTANAINNPATLEKVIEEYLTAPPPEGWQRVKISPDSKKLPLPKPDFTEAVLTSLLHRLSIGLSEEE